MSFDIDKCFKIKSVKKSYKDGDGEIIALDSVDAEIPWGASVGIVGHSGSGKSTLLHLLGLLDVPDFVNHQNGKLLDSEIIYFDGSKNFNYFTKENQKFSNSAEGDNLRQRHFGFIFQKSHLLNHLNVLENVSLTMMLDGGDKKTREERALELLKWVGLESKKYKFPKDLSGGEQQRVAVIRGICNSPRVVFADEPTGNLDKNNASIVLDLLNHWRMNGTDSKPRTLVLVTHNLEDAFNNCDHFLILKSGKVFQSKVFSKKDISSVESFQNIVIAPFSETKINKKNPPDFVQINDGDISLGDFFSFAWKDLFRKDHFESTLSNLFIILGVLVLALIGIGFYQGQSDLYNKLNNPEARMIVVDNTSLGASGSIDDNILQELYDLKLKNGSQAIVSSPYGVLRWNLVRLDFYQGAEADKLPEYRVDGRTVINEDPLIKSILNDGFSPDKAEIVVTKNFLSEDCKLSYTSPNVWMNYKNSPVALKILKVVDTLPGGYKFIIHDNLYQNIVNENLDTEQDLNFVFINNVPTSFHSDLEVLTKQVVIREHLEPLIFESNRLMLMLSRGRKKPAKDLSRVAKQIIDMIENDEKLILKDNNFKKGLMTIEIPSVTPESKVTKNLFSRASVFINSIDHAEEINGLLKKLSLTLVDESHLDLIKFFNDIIKPLSNMIFWFGMVSFFVGIFNLFVSMWQKIKQKTSEIGIIRSGGGTASLLYKLFAFEGFLIAFLVSFPGLILGYFFINSLNSILRGLSNNGTGQNLLIFDIFGAGTVLLILWALCPFATLIASFRPIRFSPAVAVR